MATNKNNQKSGNNQLGYLVKRMGNLVQTALYGIAFVVVLCVLFNPLGFLIFSIIAPRKAANVLYNDTDSLTKVLQCGLGWMVALYPFSMKKYFMKTRGLAHYSARLQRRYYFKYPSVATIKAMSPEAVKSLWRRPGEHKYNVWANIVKANIPLSTNQFYDMVEKRVWDLIQIYVEQQTPNQDMILALFPMTYDTDRQDTLVKIARLYGLPVSIVTRATSQKCLNIEKLNNALKNYSERVFVVRNSNVVSENDVASFRAFCRNTPEISEDAQVAMKAWQLDEFYKHNHQLSNNAIIRLLKTNDVDRCYQVFVHDYERVMKEPMAEVLINANAELKSTLVRAQLALGTTL